MEERKEIFEDEIPIPQIVIFLFLVIFSKCFSVVLKYIIFSVVDKKELMLEKSYRLIF